MVPNINSNKHKKQWIIFVLFCSSLAGCAISNEGSTDYRFFGAQEQQRGKYIKPVNSNHLIKAGDPLVIYIKQAFIKNFTEIRSPMRFVRGEPANGEIAIVVNAFEKGTQTLDFSADGKNNARVVFFSDDVWEGQFLNLAGLSSIYGPLKYEGAPFILDLYIVEFDTPGEQLRQLVANLAAIGATFYPPASPFAGPLAQLANTFITDDQDDRAYHYTTELHPIGGFPDISSGLLQGGHYAFIREEDRHETTPWRHLSIDENTAKIVYLPSYEGKSHCRADLLTKEYPEDCFYRENSFVVIEVNSADSSLGNDTQQMIYKNLVNKLSTVSPQLLNESISEETFKQLAAAISETRSADMFNSELKILEVSQDKLKRSVAGINVVDYWCGIDAKNKEILYPLSDQDSKRFEKRLLSLLSNCMGDLGQSLEMLKILKDRKQCGQARNKEMLVKAITCQSFQG